MEITSTQSNSFLKNPIVWKFKGSYCTQAKMIFDVSEIPEKGLELEICEKRELFDINQSDCFLSNDVIIQGVLRFFERDVLLSGRVKTGLTLACSRCLENFKFKVDSQVEAHYVPEDSVESGKAEHEVHEEDIDLEVYRDNRVSIQQAIHDQIILSVPVVALCREECKGLCATCGVNKNRDSCHCEDEQKIDPRLAILKSIKDKLK